MNVSPIVHWIVSNPSLDVNLLLGAGAVSLVLEKLLSLWGVKSKKVAFSLLHVASIVTALSTWLLANVSGSQAVGIYGTLVILAGFWHRFVVSGIYTKDVAPALQTVANETPTPAPATPAAVPEPFL